jgi:hypothetical protein
MVGVLGLPASKEKTMKTTRVRTLAFLPLVALLVFAALGVALACDWGGPDWDDDGPQLAETHLSLAADARQVLPGRTVTLTGKLTAEATETDSADDGDEAEAAEPESDDADEADLACAEPQLLSRQTVCEEGSNQGRDYRCDEDADCREETPTPVAGVEVAILAHADGEPWSQIGTATTDADGAFSATEVVDSDTRFKAVFEGDDVYDGARSCAVGVEVVAEVTAPVVPGAGVRANKSFRVKGKATRGAGRVTVTVYKRSHGKWTAKVKSVRASVSAGVYTAKLKLRAGTYRIAASQAGTSRVHGASSAKRTLRVAAHR